MKPDPLVLQRLVSLETGLEFRAEVQKPEGRQVQYVLKPVDVPQETSFLIRVSPGWRRIRISFEPGKFAGELLDAMSGTDQTGRTAFQSIVDHCRREGAEIEMKINAVPVSYGSPEIWTMKWNRFSIKLSKGQIELGTDEGEPDEDIITRWTGMFASAIVAILPLEEEFEELSSYPEGAVTTVQVNRYERDRRNRAAAISIHGSRCKACDLDLGNRYGKIAAGFIEIHHIVPVSSIGSNYRVDPKRDLVPLCPNCHAIAHRRDPPLSIEEIKRLLQSDASSGSPCLE